MVAFRPDGPPARIVRIREPAAGLDAVVVIDHYGRP